ncbi:uncharacterized protein N7487_001444 [Penicillium crustosum]|uniref:uncharacterized protein n=1 Tax=Penicillium crustosum TaxID=36656 RepID=UPI00238AFB4F|nr:uncharacterized protein N7487_001444 [Penicillium crustosum]KAJ5417894.1 hypothetical protein N7487_001444 [Penicillium crustosum]
MTNSKLAHRINLALTTTATSTSTASFSASTVFNKHTHETARAQTRLVETHPVARIGNATIFALESSSSLFLRIFDEAVGSFFDRYLLLNHFSEVFLYKQRLVRDIRRPILVFIPVFHQAISLENIYFPGFFEAGFHRGLVTI